MSFIINIFGPSTAGKSTIADILKNSIDNLDMIDFDVIKRRIPHYDWTQHAQIGRSMTLDTIKLNSNIKETILLLMPSPKDKEEFALIHSIAETQNRKLINIYLTAPNEILIERYKNRLANIDPSKREWKFKTLDQFITKLEEPNYIPRGTISFDTSLTNSDDIAKRIINLLK